MGDMMTLCIIITLCSISQFVSGTLPPPNPALCREEKAEKIKSFYECALSGCLTNINSTPMRCQTYDEVSNSWDEDSVYSQPEKSCSSDSDCILVSKIDNWLCCYEHHCDKSKIDIVESNYLSVNRSWYINKQSEYCDSFYRQYICDQKTLALNKKCQKKDSFDTIQQFIFKKLNIQTQCRKRLGEKEGVCIVQGRDGDRSLLKKCSIVLVFVGSMLFVVLFFFQQQKSSVITPTRAVTPIECHLDSEEENKAE
ncbi:ribosome maturation factor RimP [Acrasis kona]|uniref:Ribosome maturation factor RimP n=1 Tax=Acrasis kona TaxID=1008807 RepID=A0AAW2Z023_9EUKA